MGARRAITVATREAMAVCTEMTGKGEREGEGESEGWEESEE
jgi:hypothetical protein